MIVETILQTFRSSGANSDSVFKADSMHGVVGIFNERVLEAMVGVVIGAVGFGFSALSAAVTEVKNRT